MGTAGCRVRPFGQSKMERGDWREEARCARPRAPGGQGRALVGGQRLELKFLHAPAIGGRHLLR
jgi:hypothetical protein